MFHKSVSVCHWLLSSTTQCSIFFSFETKAASKYNRFKWPMFCNICFTIRFKRKQLISPTHSHMANVNKCQNAKLHVSLTLWNKTWLTHIMSVIIIKTRFHLRVYPTKTPKKIVVSLSFKCNFLCKIPANVS